MTLPHHKGWPLLGSLLPFIRDMPGFLVELRARYGPLVHFCLGRRRVVSVAEPDLIEQILVPDAELFLKSQGMRRTDVVLGNGLLLSQGEFHLKQRRLASKAFIKSRIDSYADSMVAITQRHTSRWENGSQLEIGPEMMELTLGIVAKTLLDHDTTRDVADVEAAMDEFMRLFPILLLPGADLLNALPLPTTLALGKARKGLDKVVYRILDERAADPRDRGDLLSMLMMAVDEETDGKGMSREQLRDEVLTIFLAGHETTASALCWTFLLLALNPRVYQTMLDEVDRVLGSRAATAADYPDLDYTRRVFAEALRIYPPAWTMGRECRQDYQLGPHMLKEGTNILLSPYVLGRDARFFPEPLVFEPDRFLKSNERPRYAFFPFGGGRRKCLGERFAWMEAVLILATISQRFRLSYQGARLPQYKASLTLRMEDSTRFTLHSR